MNKNSDSAPLAGCELINGQWVINGEPQNLAAELSTLRAQIEILQGAYDAAKDHAKALQAENECLKAIERQHIELTFSVNKTMERMSAENAELHNGANVLRAEIARLREALQDVVFGLKNAETIGEIDIAQETAQDAINATTPDPIYTAAPQMLEALKQCLPLLQHFIKNQDFVGTVQVQEAIKAAEIPA